MARKNRSAARIHTPRRAQGPLLVLLVVVVSIPLAAWLLSSSPNPPRKRNPETHSTYSVATLKRAIENGDFENAELQVQQLLATSTPSNEVLLLAAETSAQLGKLDDAISFCDRCIDDSSLEYEASVWIPCELLLRDGQLSAAEIRLQNLLQRFPNHTQGRKRLVYVLGICGRRWESQEHLLALVQQGHVDLETLISLGETSRMPDSREQLGIVAEKHSNDVLLRLGRARLALANNGVEEAIEGLSTITKSSPEIAEAWARLGEALSKSADPKDAKRDLLTWNASLPKSAELHPTVWFVKALLAEQDGQLESSARCLWEAINRDPNYGAALYQLGLTLKTLGRGKEAKLMLDRHQTLTDYIRAVDRLAGKPPQLDAVLKAASLAEQCGRLWESWSWYGIARSLTPNDSLVSRKFSQLSSQLGTLPPQTIKKHQPALLVNLSDFSLPTYTRATSVAGDARPAHTNAATVRFTSEAKLRGIDFNYFSNPTPGAEGKHIYEFAGGGIAILDYDLDGWCDVYLTQGSRWPPGSVDTNRVDIDSPRFHNTLYRNIAGERFSKTPEGIAAADTGFGQGATIGDFNSDGFPDIYVANIGLNSLFQNNGDGTFSDASSLLGSRSSQWTTSCILVDVNMDGHPDVYDVNYLEGENIFSRVCVWPQGKKRICGPATFSPARDQLLLNLGMDGFTSKTVELDVPSGNGLGVVAACFDRNAPNQPRPLQLFVANDQQPNFLFTYETTQPPILSETAVLMGLAYDAQGAAQACMGVAAGDANEDGQIDLFVTNYFQESNALYVQQSPGTFADRSLESSLRDPSYAMLGFGTQFLDADLDGDLDLVLTNGHLDDFSFMNQPYQMPPQFFLNESRGRFTELKGDTVGPYFDGLYRGRSLARLDWNRDGRPDFIVSHLDAPVALLTNATESAGNYFSIDLRGVQSSRDAIGASVTIWVGDRQWTQQLTAGDGYQASNARQLIFGLADAEQVDRMQVAWPSGIQQDLTTPMLANQSYLLVEGKDIYVCPPTSSARSTQ